MRQDERPEPSIANADAPILPEDRPPAERRTLGVVGFIGLALIVAILVALVAYLYVGRRTGVQPAGPAGAKSAPANPNPSMGPSRP